MGNNRMVGKMIWQMALLAGMGLCVMTAWAQGAAAVESGSINVRDFGAKGDGKTDDTQAIRSALDAAEQTGRGERYEKKGAYYKSMAEVVFPAGAYVISDTLELKVKNIRGIGDPNIRQAHADKDIFHSTNAWQGKISGITFLGGRSHLNLGNPNTDKGHFSIADCKFYNASGPAIHFRKGSNSTFLTIKDCVISDCMQALISHTDWTTLRDTWISSSAGMDNMAVIENYGFMTLDNMLGVPRATGQDQRWVDNHGQLHVTGSRFGAEGGGFTAVVNFAKFSPQVGGKTIVIDHSWIYAQANFKRRCAVYCEELPNMIEIRNSTLGGIPGIKVDKKIDLLTYFAGARPGVLRFNVTNCVGEFSDQVPRLLSHPVIEAAVAVDQLSPSETAAALAKAVREVKERTWPADAPPTFNGHTEKADPKDYVSLDFQNATWDLADDMDATHEPNSDYLAVAQAGDDLVIMRRREGKWPHVLVKDITIDLDKYPYLTWKLRDAVDGSPNRHAVRIIDVDSERMVSVVPKVDHGRTYQAYDVKRKLGLSGVRNLQIRFYHLGNKYIAATPGKPGHFEQAKKGDYMILDYLRFEAP